MCIFICTKQRTTSLFLFVKSKFFNVFLGRWSNFHLVPIIVPIYHISSIQGIYHQITIVQRESIPLRPEKVLTTSDNLDVYFNSFFVTSPSQSMHCWSNAHVHFLQASETRKWLPTYYLRLIFTINSHLTGPVASLCLHLCFVEIK